MPRRAPKLRKQLRNYRFAGVEHFVDLLRLLAAGFREIGPATAPAADDRRDLFHNLSGFDFLRQILRHRDYDLHFSVAGRRRRGKIRARGAGESGDRDRVDERAAGISRKSTNRAEGLSDELSKLRSDKLKDTAAA